MFGIYQKQNKAKRDKKKWYVLVLLKRVKPESQCHTYFCFIHMCQMLYDILFIKKQFFFWSSNETILIILFCMIFR